VNAQAPQINSSESKLEEVLEAVPEENANDNVSNTEDLEVSPLTCEEHNSEETEEPPKAENTEKKFPSKRKLQIQGQWRGVDPVVFFKDEAIINSIKTFYGIDERFPLNGHLITRNSDTSHVKRIYYVSNFVKDILELNFSVGQQLKITSVGMKMFVSIFYSQFRMVSDFVIATCE
jgi:multisite-specific tRNA:(cytosine-C5)-methyltransferase